MSAGAPSCTIRPWSITATRSASESASTWSWVTNNAVTPICRISVESSRRMLSRSRASRFDNGSSSKQQARPPHDRSRQRNALLLPAREPRRRAARHGLHPDQREHVHDPLLDLCARDTRPLHFERIGDIVEHVEMRPDRIGLEHHSDRALVHRNEDAARVRDHASADRDRALLGPLEAGDAAQDRGLAAPARTKQRVALRLARPKSSPRRRP